MTDKTTKSKDEAKIKRGAYNVSGGNLYIVCTSQVAVMKQGTASL